MKPCFIAREPAGRHGAGGGSRHDRAGFLPAVSQFQFVSGGRFPETSACDAEADITLLVDRSSTLRYSKYTSLRGVRVHYLRSGQPDASRKDYDKWPMN